jgi:hypothetical protein
VQTQFSQLVASLPSKLSSFVSTIEQALSCPQQSTTGGSTGGTQTSGGTTQAGGTGTLFGSIIQFVQSLVQGFLPAVQSGQAPPTTTLPGPLSGLLGGLTQGVPGFGSLPGLQVFGGFLAGMH